MLYFVKAVHAGECMYHTVALLCISASFKVFVLDVVPAWHMHTVEMHRGIDYIQAVECKICTGAFWALTALQAHHQSQHPLLNRLHTLQDYDRSCEQAERFCRCCQETLHVLVLSFPCSGEVHQCPQRSVQCLVSCNMGNRIARNCKQV